MRIAFAVATDFCGRPWGPPRIAEGIPGAEEAYIHLSNRLARRGCQVTVYAHVGPYAGSHDGVEWREIADAPADFSCDVLVTSRPEPVAALQGRAPIYFWLHVDPYGLPQSAWNRIHKFMPLSGVARMKYAAIPDDKIFVTRNGVHLADFDQSAAPAVARVPGKLVYGSDYDRGLVHLLSVWPRIRQACPHAQLAIFYGWDVIDQKIEIYTAQNRELGAQWAAFKATLEQAMAQPGVTHLGRISHQAVAREFLSAEAWAYPCTFLETSCITAMKAQIAGAIPVVFATAALRETVRWGLRGPGWDSERPPAEQRAALDQWTDALVNLLNNPAQQEALRQPMMADSRAHFGWEQVAAEWETEFAQAIRSYD